MIVTLIVLCEVGFWVLLAAGLGLRYLAKMPRTGAAVLLCEPLLEVVLLVVTVLDLRAGAAPDWKHGLAALYIGYTLAFGHYTVRWLDGHARHRLGGGPPPVKPPRFGAARARHEVRLWLRTVAGAAVAAALLQTGVWYVGDPGRTASLTSWQAVAGRVVLIHGLIALSYVLWPKKPKRGADGGGVQGPAAPADAEDAGRQVVAARPARRPERTLAAPAEGPSSSATTTFLRHAGSSRRPPRTPHGT
ncbi:MULTISPECIES: hypothetical protein [Streptomyces diastaticus group]|uniref:hypothetical protein n=1 Tax=Streptomyces diastaticus group TaxID=2849069 RepID=UPI0013C63CC5|nr:hypothetical protein [Streptomyces rutgersensis]GFH67671.1 hypothetical protein Srut_41850 [Streptomyces rutgersensis]